MMKRRAALSIPSDSYQSSDIDATGWDRGERHNLSRAAPFHILLNIRSFA
jgi:hypothetical protein